MDALDGRPGVYSARYAGEDATDADRNCKLLSELEGVENRSAHFTCAIAYISPEGQERVFEGICPGKIGFEPKGSDGFGYDPLFYWGDKTFGAHGKRRAPVTGSPRYWAISANRRR